MTTVPAPSIIPTAPTCFFCKQKVQPRMPTEVVNAPVGASTLIRPVICLAGHSYLLVKEVVL